jgi:phospholipid/cholesterol/gamma-HCH transport system substrate-binding protein
MGKIIFCDLKRNKMKNEKGFGWKLGLFVIIGFVLFLSALFFLGKHKNLFGSVFRVQATFSDVAGLKMGSNIRFGGITVGTVDDIQIINDTSVKVVMVVQSGVRKFIKKDASASISSDGLMGDKVVVISPGSTGQAEIQDNDMLPTRPPVEIEAILSSLKVSADNAALITGELSELAYRINHGKGALSKLVGDSTFASNITSTVSNLKKSSQGLSENMEAAKHNFLLRGYFKKKKKAEEKKKKDQEDKQPDQQQKQPEKQ